MALDKVNIDFVNWLGFKLSGKQPIQMNYSTGEEVPTFFISRKGYLTAEKAYEVYLQEVDSGKWKSSNKAV